MRKLGWTLVFFSLLALLLPNSLLAEKRLFIIDDDVGMDIWGCLRDRKKKPTQPWLGVCDPDGGLELVYALNEPDIEILGITCSWGCSSLRVCMESVKKLLKLAGREDIPVLAGAGGKDALGKPTPASQFIIEQVMSHPGRVEILATAPLTNIATAIMLEPKIVENWKALHFATGEFHGELGVWSDARLWEWTGYKDLNINVDAKATRYVLEHAGNFPIYPNEVMDDAWLSFSQWLKLASSSSQLAQHLAHQTWIMVFACSGVGRILGLKGMPLHGLIASALAFHPELFAGKVIQSPVKMIESKKGGYIFKLSQNPNLPSHTIYVELKNTELLKKQIMERLLKEK